MRRLSEPTTPALLAAAFAALASGCLDFPPAPPAAAEVDAASLDTTPAVCEPAALPPCRRCLPDGPDAACPLGCAGDACLDAALVAAGGATACALLSDGAVTCWGDATRATGSIALPSRAVDLAVGARRACARDAAGEVTCWVAGPPTPVDLPGPALLLANPSHDLHCAWLDAGLHCFDGGDVTALPGPTSARAIATGDGHGCLVDDDGALWCWGVGAYGQLGDGFRASLQPEPAQVESLADVALVGLMVGGATSCAWDAAGGVWCWGRNHRGQGGLPAPHSLGAPTPIRSAFTAGLRAGVHSGDHACVVDSDGVAHCFGAATHGATGPEPDWRAHRAVVVPGLGDVTSIAVGAGFSCAASADGLARCWGDNRLGQLGAVGPATSGEPRVATGPW